MERTPFYPPFEGIWLYYTFIIANPSGFCLAYLMKNFYYSVTPPDFVEIFQTFPHGFGPEGGGVRRKPRRFRTFSHRKSRRAATPPPARGDPEADAGLPRMTMRGAGKAFGGPAADRGTGGSKSGTATAQDSGGAESGAAATDSRSTSLGLKRTVSRGAAGSAKLLVSSSMAFAPISRVH